MPQRTWMPRVSARPDPAGGLRRRPGGARQAGWLWPHWLERQLDPRSPAFLPGGDLPYLHNLTQLDWTTIGNLDSPHEATVDPRGLVTPGPGGWSLDWWVGADDRWHVPAREAAVRQHLVGGSPVVETTLRVPTGDAVHRAYAIRRSSAEGGGEMVVVEVENRSKLPVALALGIRPYGPAGLAAVERIDLVNVTTATVDGLPALLMPRPASRFAASTGQDGDSAAVVLEGDAGDAWPDAVRCPEGLAQAAFVYPLAHGVSLRVAMPMAPDRVSRRGGGAVAFPIAVPGAEQVSAGWHAQAGRGARVELPDDRLAEAVDASRRFLLVRHDADGLAERFRDAALVLGALDAYGYHDETAAVLAGYPARQRSDGSFGERGDPAATGAALWALGRHWALARDRELVDDLAETLARGAKWVDRSRPGGDAAVWSASGLRACAEVLAAIDQSPASAEVAKVADDVWSEAVGAGADAVPLLAVALGLVPGEPGDDAALAAAVEAGRGRTIDDGPAVFDPAVGGLGPAATLLLAGAELRGGDRRALDRLTWLLDAATPTWTWPTAIHPRLGGGCAGDGQDAVVAAGLLSFVRDLLVHEAPSGLVLSGLVPDSWLGQGWEVHDAPTPYGALSYAVRWHGDRPALLWDLESHADSGPVRLTIPGLDPGWSTAEPRGETLLAAVAPPEAPKGPVAPSAPGGTASPEPGSLA